MQVLRAVMILFSILLVSISYGQTYTLDWKEYKVYQEECNLSNSTGQSSSFFDLDQSQLSFDGTTVSLQQGPEENIFCASGKIRQKNDGETYTYSATLDADSKDDCSWLLIEFSHPVTNVTFDVLDIDIALLNNWQDKLSFSPGWSSIVNNANLKIDEENHTIIGTTNCDSKSNDCNTALTFEGPLTQIRIDYCYGEGTTDHFPDRQMYNIGDIQFDKYKQMPSVSIDENCPGSESRVVIEDLVVDEGQSLEVIFAYEDGTVDHVERYEEKGIYNMDVINTFNTCGSFPAIVRIIDNPNNATHTGENIEQLDYDSEDMYMVTFEIEDNINPTFAAELPDIVYLDCNQSIPDNYNRPTRDNCNTPSMISQDVIEVDLDYNDDCERYNVRKIWTITDLCGNSTVDSVDYIYIYDENSRNLGDAEDIITACNIFSPNGDGINDYFTIFLGNLNIAQAELYLFDRNGNPRYQEAGSMAGLTETSLGGNLTDGSWSSGVYIWMIKLTDAFGKSTIISREVTIVL